MRFPYLPHPKSTGCWLVQFRVVLDYLNDDPANRGRTATNRPPSDEDHGEGDVRLLQVMICGAQRSVYAIANVQFQLSTLVNSQEGLPKIVCGQVGRA